MKTNHKRDPKGGRVPLATSDNGDVKSRRRTISKYREIDVEEFDMNDKQRCGAVAPASSVEVGTPTEARRSRVVISNKRKVANLVEGASPRAWNKRGGRRLSNTSAADLEDRT